VDATGHRLAPALTGLTAGQISLEPDFRSRLDGRDRFADLMAIDGEVFREQPGRRTLRFTRHGKSYFIKQHFGAGWREIFKNLLSFRSPVLGAQNEYLAVARLKSLGVGTLNVVGYGCWGVNPATRKSFIVTEDLGDTETLEDLCRDWKENPPGVRFKRSLIARVACIARTLHENGINHRDFYLCHFRLGKGADSPLYLIDLHRAQLRSKTPRRWVVKDVGGLYFSSLDIGLKRRDLYRFMIAYRGQPLRRIMRDEADFWRQVERRAMRLKRQ
jgi:heptose I phosphotransferase